MTNAFHTPVLVQETLSYLITRTDGLYVDATLGGGGHAEQILETIGKSGHVVGIDHDFDAIEFATRRLSGFGDRVHLARENFSNMRSVLSTMGFSKVAGVVFDLGVSSFQLDEPSRGFSHRLNEKLDMRMDVRQQLSAGQIVNEYPQAELANIIWMYGEERGSRRIAKELVRRRGTRRIETTSELAEIVESVVGGRFLNKTLARVFQALRIEVNHELDHLRKALHEAFEILEPGGRVVVISYHSLEDRIVKESMKQAARTSIPSGSKIIPDKQMDPLVRILTKKPVMAGENETRSNPRSRSAKLRAAERV